MGKVLAIDYGKKRTGLALSDELQIFAFGLTTVNTPELFPYLKTLITKEKIDTVILGEPKRLNNESSSTTEMVYAFRDKFQKEYPDMPVKLIDERFTSKMAAQSLIDSGMKKQKRKDKSLLDTVSATLILQTYLEHK